jgi:flavin reductase (DIM6/NTAB) family NADH-FMN oxidoreductase RutF
MSRDTYFYRPAEGHGLDHDPFKAIVAPRPIGWISTVDLEGRVNLAPYSFFNALSSFPPILCFSSERASDTLANVRDTGEFVYNLAPAALARIVSDTSTPVPRGVSEMAMAGLEAAPCTVVKAPRVAASPASLECKVIKIERLMGLDGEESKATLVLGQVVGVHIDPAFLKDGRFDTAAAQPLMRCGYLSDYALINEMIKVKRPAVIPEDWPYELPRGATSATDPNKEKNHD